MQNRRTFLAATVAGGALLTFGLGASPARASIEDDARTFLSDLGNRAIAQLTDKSVEETERVARFPVVVDPAQLVGAEVAAFGR